MDISVMTVKTSSLKTRSPRRWRTYGEEVKNDEDESTTRIQLGEIMEGYVTTRRTVHTEELLDDLKEIMERRFSNDFNIHLIDEQWFVGGFPGPEVCPYDYHTFYIIKESNHRLQFKVSLHSTFAFWLMVIFQNELAKKYSGWVRYEGVSRADQPDTSKFPTYKSFYEQFLKQYDENDTSDGFYRWLFEGVYKDGEKQARNFEPVPVAIGQLEHSSTPTGVN
jgi:hypothetical protein